MRKVKTDIRHLGFTLMVENPLLKQKYVAPNQMQEVIERYAREHNLTTEQAQKKAKVPKWIVAGVGLHRDAARLLQIKEYPTSKFRIVGARADYTPLEIKRERTGESEAT